MKFSEINESKLDEILPALGGIAKSAMGAAQKVGGAISAASNVAKDLKKDFTKASDASYQAMGGKSSSGEESPENLTKTIAQQMADMQNKKKEIQDQIKAKQQEIAELQKALSQIK